MIPTGVSEEAGATKQRAATVSAWRKTDPGHLPPASIPDRDGSHVSSSGQRPFLFRGYQCSLHSPGHILLPGQSYASAPLVLEPDAAGAARSH